MRYDDWDVLIFQTTGRDTKDNKIPLKEFRVACHVVPDVELTHSHGSGGLPVMTCFVPSLPTGSSFHISIHCWRVPDISQYTRNYSKHTELVKFETRVLIDGRTVSVTSFDRRSKWPHVVNTSFDFNKNGEYEALKFPPFRRELLYHTVWNPGDEIGRIKVIISEGFPRDSASMPIERVKNVVAFSFQHAPLEILENNGIAWPNPSMWQRSFANHAITVPTFHPDDGAVSHMHSPRRKSLPQSQPQPIGGSQTQGFHMPMMSGILPTPPNSFFANQLLQPPLAPRFPATGASTISSSDPYSESAAHADWLNTFTTIPNNHLVNGSLARGLWANEIRHNSKHSSTDISMPDYMSSNGCESMHISGPSIEDDRLRLKVPTNTPTHGDEDMCANFSLATHTSTLPSDLAMSLTHSLLNQPMPLPAPMHDMPLPASEVKSRKENRHLAIGHSRASSNSSTSYVEHVETRKFSQPVAYITGPLNTSLAVPGPSITASPACNTPMSQRLVASAIGSRTSSCTDYAANMTNPSAGTVAVGDCSVNGPSASYGSSCGSTSGSKRMRTFTPASVKAIDKEDEPRRVSSHGRISRFTDEVSGGE